MFILTVPTVNASPDTHPYYDLDRSYMRDTAAEGFCRMLQDFANFVYMCGEHERWCFTSAAGARHFSQRRERQLGTPRVAIELRHPVRPLAREHARLTLLTDTLRQPRLQQINRIPRNVI